MYKVHCRLFCCYDSICEPSDDEMKVGDVGCEGGMIEREMNLTTLDVLSVVNLKNYRVG